MTTAERLKDRIKIVMFDRYGTASDDMAAVADGML